jgi:hypothetical protein
MESWRYLVRGCINTFDGESLFIGTRGFFSVMTGVFTATAFLSDGISARCGYASTMGYPPGESYFPRDGIFSS